MGQKVTTFKASAVYPIRYRFTCEHCGYSDGWQTFIFTTEEQITAGGWNAHLTPEEESDLNKKVSEGLQRKVSDAMNDCQRQRYPFNDTCPRCKMHQSWKNRFLYEYVLIVPICVCALLTAILWMFSLLDKGFAIWMILIATAASLIGTIIFILLRKRQTANVKRLLPEIDWNRQ